MTRAYEDGLTIVARPFHAVLRLPKAASSLMKSRPGQVRRSRPVGLASVGPGRAWRSTSRVEENTEAMS